MKRNAADCDLERDVRHLMLHLNDPAALRANALARALVFPGDEQQFLASLQAFIRSVLPPGSRMAHIVQACDIEGEPHKVVAARLGVSMRQFYRDRLHAVELVQSTIGVRQYVRVEHDGDDILADEIEALHDATAYGRTEDVVQRADRLLAGGVRPALAGALIAARARAHADSGRPDDAVGELQRARVQAAGDPRVAAEMDFAQGCALAAAGHAGGAAEFLRRAIASCAGADDATERSRRVHARYLAELGGVLQRGCDPHGAVEAFSAARGLLRTCAIVPQGQVLRAGVELAASRLAIAEMVDHAAAEALEAQRSATWHGIAAARSAADVIVAFAALTAGDPAAALERLPDAASLASSGAGAWLGRQLLLVSRVHNAAGDCDAALRAVAAARAAIPDGHALEQIADLRDAEALNAAGRAEHALRAAGAALQRAGASGRSHTLGALHLAIADARFRLGSTRLAVQHCRAGIELLREGAFVYDLACALRFAASLTGDVQYVREERALLAG